MKTYEELVKEYKKRQHDTVVDTIASGLTYLDEIAVDMGLLEETGIWTELTESVSGLLPFVIISASAGSKVLLIDADMRKTVMLQRYRIDNEGQKVGGLTHYLSGQATLEEIISETMADPNPFPPFSFELLMVFLGPVLILAALAAGILVLRKRRRGHRMKTPKPSHRYVK